MKTKLIACVVTLLCAQSTQAFACAVCFSAADSKTTEHMAAAIWFMMAAVMSVLGGVGAFGFHLWRHANTPLEPHQQLVEEDLEKYG